MRLLLCLQPQVFTVCPNHEMVMFQPRTVTTLYLGSVANYTFYSNPFTPPVSTGFLYLFISPLYPTTPPSVGFVVISPLFCTHSPPFLLSQITVHLDIACTLHTPASDICLCAQRHVTTSVPVSCYCAPSPPAVLGLIPGP